MNAVQKIQGVTGQQFVPGDKDYPKWETQYATSSHKGDPNMNPGLIVRATSNEDIQLVIAQARKLKIAIAIRTGGHQYSGASSTSLSNIQLDLRDTFRTSEDRVYFKEAGYVRTSVSWALSEFNEFLGQNHIFVPHGDCQSVHVGGHMQTGGYGQLGRSFGLFGDHITSFEIIDYDGKVREITRSDPELFFAWLGGSPGNLGVLTHFSVQVHRDEDYSGARGLKALHWWTNDVLTDALKRLAKMSDDNEFPRNFDLCVNALSGEANLAGYTRGLEEELRRKHPELHDETGRMTVRPPAIVIYAQWVPLSPTDKYDEGVKAWFDDLTSDSHLWIGGVEEKPMSELTAQWIFREDREFPLPYVKRTYLTNSTELSTNGWVDWVVNRLDAGSDLGLSISSQMQSFGGKYSRFRTNADNGTSYSWRSDTTLALTMDGFHPDNDTGVNNAEKWQSGNDSEALGPNGKFSKEDRRVLWGSYGNFDLDAVWNCYYEDRAKYERLMKARKAADPEGIFTPNTFSVKRAD